MYNIKIYNFEKKYLLEELIKVFLMPQQYRILDENEDDEGLENLIYINKENFTDRNLIKQQIYKILSDITGKKPQWGILTGIRPVKLCGEKYESCKSEDKTVQWLKDYFYLSSEKANLVMRMYLYQIRQIGKAKDDSAGVYIGIPFCPTRCVYCSFASNQVEHEEIKKYLKALHKEIKYVGMQMANNDIFPETIYIGGGTPTTLTTDELSELLSTIKSSFDFSRVIEFTVEAGRPDTISKEKLETMKKYGVDRISINPQSMKDKTLRLIGRNHSPEDIVTAFEIGKNISFKSINADVIAGLPEETTDDFEQTLKKIVALEPENITVHSLAVKKASKLIDIDKNYHYKKEAIVWEMLKKADTILTENHYLPYYLYRQKHMAGAFENTGYCKDDNVCVYNMRIMDEHQTIIALGAGGITKVYYPEENRLERVPNVTNYEEYISRINEMLERKDKELFRR